MAELRAKTKSDASQKPIEQTKPNKREEAIEKHSNINRDIGEIEMLLNQSGIDEATKKQYRQRLAIIKEQSSQARNDVNASRYIPFTPNAETKRDAGIETINGLSVEVKDILKRLRVSQEGLNIGPSHQQESTTEERSRTPYERALEIHRQLSSKIDHIELLLKQVSINDKNTYYERIKIINKEASEALGNAYRQKGVIGMLGSGKKREASVQRINDHLLEATTILEDLQKSQGKQRATAEVGTSYQQDSPEKRSNKLEQQKKKYQLIMSKIEEAKTLLPESSLDEGTKKTLSGELETIAEKSKQALGAIRRNELSHSPLSTETRRAMGTQTINKHLSEIERILMKLRNPDISDISEYTEGHRRRLKNLAKRDLDTAAKQCLKVLMYTETKEPTFVRFEQEACVETVMHERAEKPGMLIFDFDDTVIRDHLSRNKIDEDADLSQIREWSISDQWVEGVSTSMNNYGLPASIITSRRIKHIEAAFDNTGDKGRDLKGRMEIIGEGGAAHKGPKTDGKMQPIDARGIEYTDEAMNLMNRIGGEIPKSVTLNKLKQEGIIPEKTRITLKVLGGSVLGGLGTRALRDSVQKAHDMGADIDVESTINAVNEELQNIVDGVLKNSNFAWTFDKKQGVIIKPNESTELAGLDKEYALRTLVEAYKVRSVVIFGDSPNDLKMKRAAEKLKKDGVLDNYIFVAVEHPTSITESKQEVLDEADFIVHGTNGTSDLIQRMTVLLKEGSNFSKPSLLEGDLS